jgi:glutamate--cysteine ligase
MSVAAFWTGLLYDREALEGATAVLAPCARGWNDLKRRAARDALRARVDDCTTLLDLARDCVKLAAAGLERRGRGEERFLGPIEEVAATGKTFAERALDEYARGGLAAVIESAAV